MQRDDFAIICLVFTAYHLLGASVFLDKHARAHFVFPFAKSTPPPPRVLVPHGAFCWIFTGLGPPHSCLWRRCFFGSSTNVSSDTCVPLSLATLPWLFTQLSPISEDFPGADTIAPSSFSIFLFSHFFSSTLITI